MSRLIKKCCPFMIILFAVSVCAPVLLSQDDSLQIEEGVNVEEELDFDDPFSAPLNPIMQVQRTQIVQRVDMGFQLEGISMGPDGFTFAIIDGKVFQEGVRKDDLVVVQIRKKEVDIIANGQPKTLKMVPTGAQGVPGDAGPGSDESEAQMTNDLEQEFGFPVDDIGGEAPEDLEDVY